MDLFERIEDYSIKAVFYENDQYFTIEELYEAFKARLINELTVDTPELLEPAKLTDEI